MTIRLPNEQSEERGEDMSVRDALDIKVKPRRDRYLKWYEKQWGSGMLFGLTCGWMIGIATSVPLAFGAKWLVEAWFK